MVCIWGYSRRFMVGATYDGVFRWAVFGFTALTVNMVYKLNIL